MKYLYVIESGTLGEFLKVGVSNDVMSRLAALQTGNPHPLRILVCFEFQNAEIVERAIHQRFSSERVQGEWFKLTAQEFHDLCVACEYLGGVRVIDKAGTLTEREIQDAEDAQKVLEDFRIERRIGSGGWRGENR